ncbi:NADH-cytochrome b5 reductase [Melia azedarach]|uniref:NADH-cytochrome b5 reductase n=1 Tax=Melia azedarach TaxID=155640 RepID=A0ACC1YMI5_MELAZ|nr:NADH-cytochrome b5 reductase [Melia azedarach]
MEVLHSHRVGMLSIAVALVAIGAGTAYYLYITKKSKGCLDPENFKEFKLVKRTQLSHNVAKFKFALPTPTSVFGLPIGQHMSCRGRDALDEEVVKPYTPTTLDSDLGYFELVIKNYTRKKERKGAELTGGLSLFSSGSSGLLGASTFLIFETRNIAKWMSPAAKRIQLATKR